MIDPEPSTPAVSKEDGSPWKRALRVAKIVLAVVCVAGGLWLLVRQYREVRPEEILAGYREIPPWKIGLAVLLTGLYYGALIVFDSIALRSIGKRFGLGQTALGAIAGHSVGNQFGWLLGGTAARWYVHSDRGLRGWAFVRFVAILTTGFWSGLLVMAGLVFTAYPTPIPEFHLQRNRPSEATAPHDAGDSAAEPRHVWSPKSIGLRDTRPLGYGCLALAATWTLLAIAWPKRGMEGAAIRSPSWRTYLALIGISAADFAVAAMVFHVLLPPSTSAPFAIVLCGFLLAQIVVALSHVPSGFGVFEAVILATLGLAPEQSGRVIGVCLVYRVVYFLLPLGVALALIGWNEFFSPRRGPDDDDDGPPEPPL